MFIVSNKELSLFAGGCSMSNILQAMEVRLTYESFFLWLLCQSIHVGSDKKLRLMWSTLDWRRVDHDHCFVFLRVALSSHCGSILKLARCVTGNQQNADQHHDKNTAAAATSKSGGEAMGPLHDPVTWYKITHAGEQAVQWDFQNKGRSRWTCKNCIVLEVPLFNYLLTSMCDFVPCDRIVQRTHSLSFRWFLHVKQLAFCPPSKFCRMFSNIFCIIFFLLCYRHLVSWRKDWELLVKS